MKFFTTGLDANGRSTHGLINFKMTKLSETEFVSAKQPGTYWYIGMSNNPSPTSRTDKNYDPPGGYFEQHTGGLPHIPVLLTGYSETTLQDGTTCRFAPGDFHVTSAGAQHQSSSASSVAVTQLVVYLPGTATDIDFYRVAKNFAPLVDCTG